MVLNKKGVFVTMIAIIVSSILITLFSVFQATPYDFEYETINLRISLVNSYMSNLEGYMGNLVNVHSRNAINELVELMIEQGAYFNSFELAFDRCFKGEEFNLNGSSFTCSSNISERLDIWNTMIYENMNINGTYSITHVDLSQANPWYLLVNVSFHAYINDSYAEWEINKNIPVYVFIGGFNDPTYYIINVETSDDLNSTIVPEPSLALYSNQLLEGDTIWIEAPSTLNTVLLNSSGPDNRVYFAYDGAPSFLDRLNNRLDRESDKGIVSIIPGNLAEEDRPHMDYLYFRQNCKTENYIKYNFTSVRESERKDFYEVNTSENGIHNTIVSMGIATLTNMDNSSYYESHICS